jgi:heme/copper-type cytochrome/quinol oxidase subunit 2
MNLYGQTEIDKEPEKNRSWWWIGPVILIIGLLMYLCGCSNIGQYHREYYPNGQIKTHDEFYSWKFLYWFGAGQAYSESDYWTLYGENVTTYPDPNAIEAMAKAAELWLSAGM